MQVKKNTVVSFHYILKDDNTSVIDSSTEGEPVSFIMGHNQILQGLEESILDKKLGDTFSVIIPPEKAYGLRDDKKIKVIDRSFFGDEPVYIGMQFNMTSETDALQYETMIIVGVTQDNVTVDSNHVMAGARLNFEVSIVDARAATASEIATGQIEAKGIDKDKNVSIEGKDEEGKQENKIELVSC